MANATLSNCEGVFAIHKPPHLTSAGVIRDVQHAFKGSQHFQPWIDREQSRKDDEKRRWRGKKLGRKGRRPAEVKIGHGGTLDPMATGVLVLGVGNGTKSLIKFLDCTKTYEAVFLFGAATDTYDCWGRIVARKPTEHLTKGMVEEALEQYRGNIMQKPPIFSALSVQGKRLYKYAREGIVPPTEIEARSVEVKELEMLEWMEGGTHQYKYPKQEAEKSSKVFAEKMLHLHSGVQEEASSADVTAVAESSNEPDAELGAKRKRDDSTAEEAASPGNAPSPKRSKPAVDARQTRSAGPDVEGPPCPAPAVRLRMTTTSGFYVRSLAHDLGAAVGSLGMMTELVRERQGVFEVGKNLLPYEDLAKGEEVWGPKVGDFLEAWNDRPEPEESGEQATKPQATKPQATKPRQGGVEAPKKRRNSSSDED